MNKKDKIFIGVSDIGNIQVNLKHALRKAGLNCDSFLWSNDSNKFYTDKKSKRLFLFNTLNPPFRISGKNIFHLVNKGIKILHFVTIAFRYNVFFFISPQSFDENHITTGILRKLGKKVIFLFTGCVERDTAFDRLNPDYICNNCLDTCLQQFCLCQDLGKKITRVRSMEKNSNFIIAQPDISGFVSDKKKLLWFYLADTYSPHENLVTKKYSSERIIIAHLPSNPKVKQSQNIIPVLKRFSGTNDIEIIIKEESWDRDRLLKTLEEAHILVNSIGTGYNMTAVEAMGRGCVVMNSHPSWFKEFVPEAPVIHITRDSLESDIRKLIRNRDLLKEISAMSINYYKKYHSAEAVGLYYKQKLGLK